MAVAGTPAEAIPRFRELIALGVDEFVLTITGPRPEETFHMLAEGVLPRV